MAGGGGGRGGRAAGALRVALRGYILLFHFSECFHTVPRLTIRFRLSACVAEDPRHEGRQEQS